MTRPFALVCLLLAAPAAFAQTAPADPYVRVEDGHFVRGGQPYYFVGANLWFGMNLGSSGAGGDRARLVRELDRLQALGITNLRITAASEGPAGAPFRVHPAVQNAPGEYDEQLLRGLDFVLAEMGERDMTAVLVMNNFFQWSGGMAQYVAWATGTEIPYPDTDGHTWDEFQTYSSRFYTLPAAQQIADDYTRALVLRTNTVTGRPYREDPAIMAWQLGNEPRGYAHPEAYVVWVDRAAGLIQMLAPNHLVSLGGEGKVNGDYARTEFERVSRSPNLDYLTAHIWIENWGWYQPETDPAGTFPVAVGNAMAYLGDHVAVASEVGKPLVVEEFGVSRDGRSYRPDAPVTYRDTYYTILYAALQKLAEEGRPVGGSNVWSWSGEGLPTTAGAGWAPGDTFTGDPPHEIQGWYSVYERDASTQAVIRAAAEKMNALGRPAAPAN